jgi:hypothetical protein
VLATVQSSCRRSDDVPVQPLPPLTRPTAEARVGVPELAGTWRFAGWEVVSPRVMAEVGEPRRPGDLVVQTQRIDSLAGYLVRDEAPVRLVGEVRRDGVVALVTVSNEQQPRFAAGRVVADTLWIELSTLTAGELSPPTMRWAFVRGPVGQAWLRLPGGTLLRDTVIAPPPLAETPPAPPAARPAEPAPPPAPRPAEAPPVREPPPTPERQPPPAEPAPGEPPPQPAEPAEPRDTARWLPPPGPEVDTPPLRR